MSFHVSRWAKSRLGNFLDWCRVSCCNFWVWSWFRQYWSCWGQQFAMAGYSEFRGFADSGVSTHPRHRNNACSRQVDTSFSGFGRTPTYVTSITSSYLHWRVKGASSVYSPEKRGFWLYLPQGESKYDVHIVCFVLELIFLCFADMPTNSSLP